MTNQSPYERDRIGQQEAQQQVEEGRVRIAVLEHRDEQRGQQNAAHELEPTGHPTSVARVGA